MTHTTESMVTQAALEPCPFCGGKGEIIERSNPLSKWRWSVDCSSTTCGASGPVEATAAEAIAAWNTRTAAQPEREAVLGLEWSEDGYSLRTPYDGDVNDDTGQHIVVGGETVVTFSDSDEGDRAREWFQVALTTPVPAVSRDEIVAIFSENLPEQAARLGVHHNGIESPGQWRDRVRKAAILSRIRGEG